VSRRRGAGETWVYGVHAVRALLARVPDRVRRVAVLKGREDDPALAPVRETCAAQGIALEPLSAAALAARVGDVVHQGVAADVVPAALLNESDLKALIAGLARPPLVLVLDGVEDPRNLGACLRSADAAGVDAVVIPARRAAGLTPAAVKTASGAAAAVPVAAVANIARVLRSLKDGGVWVTGLDERGEQTLFEADLTGPAALVLGGEGGGLRRLTCELCDRLVRIPMHGVVESLNVSVAAGVCLYEALRQRGPG
jgi:23S rRNA (guanosine2251-2'-O)-methyltransferase